MCVVLPGRCDCGLKHEGVNDALEPYHAGVGQFDLQLRARAGVEDRHRDEIRGRGTGGHGHMTRGVLCGNLSQGVRRSLMDTFLPVVERRDTESLSGNAPST
jgi:hypothetical protein